MFEIITDFSYFQRDRVIFFCGHPELPKTQKYIAWMSERVEKTLLFMLLKFMVSKKLTELSIHPETEMTILDFDDFVISNPI